MSGAPAELTESASADILPISTINFTLGRQSLLRWGRDVPNITHSRWNGPPELQHSGMTGVAKLNKILIRAAFVVLAERTNVDFQGAGRSNRHAPMLHVAF